MNETQLLEQFDAFRQPCTVSLGDGRVVSVEANPSKVTMEFDSTPAHCHSGTVVQGGFVAGMLDSAMSMAVMAYTDFVKSPATLELKVSYLSTTMPGRNTAIGWVVKAGKTIAFVEGELFNECGELLAKASSSARLVPRHDAPS